MHGVLLLSSKNFEFFEKEVFSKKQGQAAIKVRLSVYQPPKKATPVPPKSLKGKQKLKEKKKKTSKKSEASKSKVKKTQGTDTVLAKYLSEVRAAIMQKKIKLRMAKRLRLKGDVGLYFLLKKPNIIEGVRVMKPSKFPQLNQSALATMDAVKDVPLMPKELELDQIPITVVISYQ